MNSQCLAGHSLHSYACPRPHQRLIDRFDEQREDYRAGKYNETQVRREFIDPMFQALGWDIDNTQGYAEQYKDVVHEDAVKIGGATKAPDYSFRVGGVRKFFLEAKKPSIDIGKDTAPAYQLRRYAWSAKLSLSVLTDFEEFAAYDCRVKPAQTDKASTARTIYIPYTSYADKWDDIANVFSREAVLKGSFDRYVESKKKMRGTAEVDAAFLTEIETWRADLARNIALRNPNLSQRELNIAVQLTIDRIIFLRICEDRGIENYGQLQALRNGPETYDRLKILFRNADDRYNSGLFHFRREQARADHDTWTLSLSIDDKVLKPILKNLYYPDSPYEFSVLPADILGQVYEQFLGKVIHLKGKSAVVEDKPEVKKAGGVYYTPTYIVDYIVKNTVGKLLEGFGSGGSGLGVKQSTPAARNPRPETLTLRVLDPACGSGSFLIGAYQYLLDWYLDRYNESPDKYLKGKSPRIAQSQLPRDPRDPRGGNDYRLTTEERKRIPLTHIYGVDIDSQAVEVTKLSLLLKVLEGETAHTLQQQLDLIHKRALPDLANNIKCGNSLIGPDFYENTQLELTDEDHYRINVFDWKKEFAEVFRGENPGFDAVIGNPPYDVIEKERGAASWPHDLLREYLERTTHLNEGLGGKLNLFRLFVVRGVKLSRSEGRFGMIIPLALLADITCKNTRWFLLNKSSTARSNCFPQKDVPARRVFKRAKLSTLVYTSRISHVSDSNGHLLDLIVHPSNTFEEVAKRASMSLEEIRAVDPETLPIPLASQNDWQLCTRIHSDPKFFRLDQIPDLLNRRGEINQTVYRKYISDDKRKITTA